MKTFRQLLVFSFLFLISFSLFTQHEADVWYFYDSVSLDFTGQTPILKEGDHAMVAKEGSGILSDNEGFVLFYTNGGHGDTLLSPRHRGTIYNRDHEVMYEFRSNEGGGISATQSSIILPNPGNACLYYLFTQTDLENKDSGNGVRGFRIDMQRNGGMGLVDSSSANFQVLPNSVEALHAIESLGGSRYFLLANYSPQSADTDSIAVLEVGSGGVFPLDNYAADTTVLYIVASPNREWVIGGNTLFEFDPLTGEMTEKENLGIQTNYAAFSPSSRYMYVITPSSLEYRVLQYDLGAMDITASATEIGVFNRDIDPSTGERENYGVFNMQVASDGNIYIATVKRGNFDSVPYIARIRCSNSTEAYVEKDVFTFQSKDDLLFQAFPNLMNHYFADEDTFTLDLGPDLMTLCDGDSIYLDAGDWPGASYLWSTGDTTSSIWVDTVGIFSVEVTNDCGVQSDAILIDDANPTVAIVLRERSCEEECVKLEALSDQDVSFEWMDGPKAAYYNVNTYGVYTVTVTDSCGNIGIGTFEYMEIPPPMVTILQDASQYCATDTIRLVAQSDATSYEWSTGEFGPEIFVTAAGEYSVLARNACGETEEFTVVELPECPEDDCIEMPNAFTPNRDEVNDQFGPVIECPVERFSMEIYSRWGEKIFETTDPTNRWDGTYDGKDAASDVYVYIISYFDLRTPEEPRIKKGEIALIR